MRSGATSPPFQIERFANGPALATNSRRTTGTGADGPAGPYCLQRRVYALINGAGPQLSATFCNRWVESPPPLVPFPFLDGRSEPCDTASTSRSSLPVRSARCACGALLWLRRAAAGTNSRVVENEVCRGRRLHAPRMGTLRTQHPMMGGARSVSRWSLTSESVGLSPGCRVAEQPLKQSAGPADFSAATGVYFDRSSRPLLSFSFAGHGVCTNR
jgi:hypothetical protein